MSCDAVLVMYVTRMAGTRVCAEGQRGEIEVTYLMTPSVANHVASVGNEVRA